jgi:hypothetical protein
MSEGRGSTPTGVGLGRRVLLLAPAVSEGCRVGFLWPAVEALGGLRLVMIFGLASMEEGQMLWPVAVGVPSVVEVAGVEARVRRLVLMLVIGMRRW